MKTWVCRAREVINHEWEVDAETLEEARELASGGCWMDCETKNALFGDIKIIEAAKA